MSSFELSGKSDFPQLGANCLLLYLSSMEFGAVLSEGDDWTRLMAGFVLGFSAHCPDISGGDVSAEQRDLKVNNDIILLLRSLLENFSRFGGVSCTCNGIEFI